MNQDPTEVKIQEKPRIQAIVDALQLLGWSLDQQSKKTCAIEPVAGIPEWWPTRVGARRPQLILFFAPKNKDGSWGPVSSKISVPWPKPPSTPPPVGMYLKGTHYCRLTLADNSKLIVNGASPLEAERMVNRIKPYIQASYLQDSVQRTGKNKGKEISSFKVYPKYCYYYANGQENAIPDWRGTYS